MCYGTLHQEVAAICEQAGRMEQQRRAGRGGTTALGLVALTLLAFMGLMAYGMARQPTGKGGFSTNEIGQLMPLTPRPASEFRITLYSGQDVSPSELRGRPVVINFWASWCPPCKVEAPAFERGYQRYHDRVNFLGINIWDRPDEAQKFLKSFNLTYPNGSNDKGDIPIEYGLTGIPETYFVNKDGVLTHRWIGPITDAQLTTILEQIL
jgi:cytochrome c biogenesis protein CcmG/thiol:disulfide interchange protein DsbE